MNPDSENPSFKVSMSTSKKPRTSAQKKIGFWSQVGITFFIVSGGPYGLESAVGAIGPGWTLVLLLLIPLLWALPTTLMVAELSAMMPERGGYFTWVKKGMGPLWGFQEGWWTLCYSAVDLAIYPVLFVTYLSYFWPGLQDSSWRWPVAAIFAILGFAGNLRSSAKVGRDKIWEIFAVMTPFVLLLGFGFFYGDWGLTKTALGDIMKPTQPYGGANLAAGLAILIWNFTGWDNACTYADEIDEASRNIPKSQFFTLGLVVLSYILPLLAGFKATINPVDWGQSSGWPDIAAKLVGPWLGTITGIAAIVSAWALYNSQLLYIARLPAAMADEGMLPKVFAKESVKGGVPFVSLAVAALAAAILCGFSLGKLMILDILLYSLGLGLEFLALIYLRHRDPQAARPYRIPLKTWGLGILFLFPMGLALIVAVTSVMGENGSLLQVGMAGAAVLFGFLIYAARAKALKKFAMMPGKQAQTQNSSI